MDTLQTPKNQIKTKRYLSKFSWKNLTKDGGQKLMNTLQIQKFLNDSAYNLDYKSYGLQR